MRLKVNFTQNTENVPFTYLNKLKSYIHKILGDNNQYHDAFSNYQISRLNGSIFDKKNNCLQFKNGGYFYVASLDMEFITSFITKIYSNNDFGYGMKLVSVEKVPDEITNIKKVAEDVYYITPKSPILLKESENKKTKFFTFKDDPEIVNLKMKNIIMKGLKMNNIPINDFEISFDVKSLNKKTKSDLIGTIYNVSSICPLIVKTKDLQLINFIKNFGIGNSRGCGFGYIL